MDPRLLEILVCPITKGPLDFHKDKQELWSVSARLAYPIRDGIPVMLEDEARALSDEEVAPARWTCLSRSSFRPVMRRADCPANRFSTSPASR